MFRIVKHPFGAHNRASAHKNRAPAQMEFFVLKCVINQSLGFTVSSVCKSEYGRDVLHDVKKKKTPLKFREFLSVSSLGCKEDMFQFSLVKNSLLFF